MKIVNAYVLTLLFVFTALTMPVSVNAAALATIGSQASQPSVPVKSILICAPTVTAAAQPMTYEIQGTALWLQFAIGGLPQMTEEPTWGVLEFGERALSRKLNRTVAPDGASKTAMEGGVQEIAIGNLDLKQNVYTLTYDIYDRSGNKLTGNPLEIRGTQAQFLAGVPLLANQFTAFLGIGNPALPPFPYTDQTLASIADPNAAPLCQSLATDVGDASYFLSLVAVTQPGCDQSTRDLLDARLLSSPDSVAIIYDQVAKLKSSLIDLPTLDQLIATNPNSILLWQTKQNLAASKDDYAEMEHDADQMVSVAPGSSEALRMAERTYSYCAGSIRQARLANDLSQAEWTRLDNLYDKATVAAKQWSVLAPNVGAAWLAVAEDATFSSDTTTSDMAIWKAVAMCDDKKAAYNWGLQMFQDKWGGSIVDLTNLARLMVNDNTISADYLADSSQTLVDDRDKPVKALLLNSAISKAEATCASTKAQLDLIDLNAPERLAVVEAAASALEDAARIYGKAQRYSDDIAKWKAANLLVGDPYNYQSLGSAYCQNKDYVNGAAEYRITLQTYPRDTTTLDYLAYADTMSRNFVEGEVVALKAVGVSECV